MFVIIIMYLFSFLKSDAQALAAKVAVCSYFQKKFFWISHYSHIVLNITEKAKQAKAAAEK